MRKFGLLLYVTILCVIFNSFNIVCEEKKACLEDMPIIEHEKYEGNEGDSTIFNLDGNGLTQCDDGHTGTRYGNIGLNGEVFNNGFEVWIARWNYGDAISWASATFDLGGRYNRLIGKTDLIKSYNIDNFDTTVYFYDNDKLLASYRLTPNDYQKEIDVDLHNIKELKLLVKDNIETGGGTSFALYDMYLSNEEKTSNEKEIKQYKYNGHTYQFFDISMTWKEAKEYCEKLGGHLATITTEEEQNCISQNNYGANKDFYWLGGTDETVEGNWKWITGEEWNYTNWCEGSPDNYNTENYLGMINKETIWGSGRAVKNRWNDFSDKDVDLMGFICEWDDGNIKEMTSFDSVVSSWAKKEIEDAYEEKIIPEELIGEDLTKKADRAEFAAIAVKMYENLSGKQTSSAVNPFNDINDNKYKEDILKAYSLNITLGTGKDEFTPNDNITREQMAAMLTRAYKKSEFEGWSIERDDKYPLNYMGVQKFSDDDEISDYAKEAVYFMVRWGVIQGVGNNAFAPKGSIGLDEGYGYATREQALAIALRSMKYLKK